MKIDIDHTKLKNDLIELCQTPGPTQSCIRFSKKDPRIDGNFPIEEIIENIVGRINQELDIEKKGKLQIIRYMGNLIIVGGLKEFVDDRHETKIIDASELDESARASPNNIVKRIKEIPVAFGAHIDEITYIVSRKRDKIEDENLWEDDEEIWEVIPICNPPVRISAWKKYFGADNKHIVLARAELIRPECRITGYRKRKIQIIGSGEISVLYIPKGLEKTAEDLKKIDEDSNQMESISTDRDTIFEAMGYVEKKSPAECFILRVKGVKGIRPGDMVTSNYKELDKETPDILETNALDDRVGCIAAIYAVQELARRNVCSKAILTSSEEGVPKDASWGRLVESCYEKFCEMDGITLVCDGMDGARMEQTNRFQNDSWVVHNFTKAPDLNEPLKSAVIIPFTANGKGGGDPGIFSMFMEEIIPAISSIYTEPDPVAVTSTDYSGRSFDIKIMDRWGLIGFVQWSCGVPQKLDSVCHNREYVDISQVINIIRTMAHFAFYIVNTQKGESALHHLS